MNKLTVFVLALISTINLWAIEKEPIKSTISEVTIYTSGAQVTRKASFNVKTGITELILEGVSPNIDARSLQVKAFGNVVIIDSKYGIFYPEPKEVKLEGLPLKIRKDISLLQDSIDNLQYEITELTDEINILNNSKSILANNGAIRGVGKVNDSIQLLKAAMDFYQVKMNEINKKLQVLNKKKKERDARMNRMNQRMTDLVNFQSSTNPDEPKGPIHRIVVTVQSKETVAGKLSVSYLVANASWVPTYDLRADILTGKVNLTYKANITQSSGEIWDNVALTLSTNDPYQNKTKPELHPWYVDFYRAVNYGYDKNINYGRTNAYGVAPAAKESSDYESSKLEEVTLNQAETAASFTTLVDRVISVEYKIDLPYTIEADGESHLVLVRNIDLNANYRYYSVPKVDPSVFLVAEILKLDELQLVPATANIFFDGTYMGETYIDPSQMEDTLKLSLGKDPNIIVKRILLKKEYKEKIIGNDKERSYSFEISMKNLKDKSIELIIEDQFPVTSNGDIVIEPIDWDKADYEVTSGKLKWKVDLKAKEAKKVTFSYKIKHPKDQNVVVQ